MAFRITSLVIVGHNSSQNFGVIYYHYLTSLATSLQVIIHKQMVMREAFRHHGFTGNIVSDRGPQFISKFWRHLLSLLKIACNLSSSYHPQTDGQTERTNQTLEQYLRFFICYQQDDWVDILHFTEFAYNNSVHSSSKVTSFFAYTSHHPRWNFLELSDVPTNPVAED